MIHNPLQIRRHMGCCGQNYVIEYNTQHEHAQAHASIAKWVKEHKNTCIFQKAEHDDISEVGEPHDNS